MPHSLLSIVFVTGLLLTTHPPLGYKYTKGWEKSSKVKTESIFSPKGKIYCWDKFRELITEVPNRLGPKNPTTACDDRK